MEMLYKYIYRLYSKGPSRNELIKKLPFSDPTLPLSRKVAVNCVTILGSVFLYARAILYR